jgi:hypothetical protein
MTGRVPPSFKLEELCHRNFAFTMYHAEQMPLIELRNPEVASLGPDLWRVRVDVCNRRLIPSTTAQGAARKVGPRDALELSGAGVRVLAGGRLPDRFLGPFEFVEYNPHRLWLDTGVPGENCLTAQWIVAGKGAVRVSFRGPRAAPVALDIPLAAAGAPN